MRRSRRGISIVDALVGCSLVLLGLCVIVNVLPTSASTLLSARNNTVATHVAKAQLEAATSLPFASVASSTPAPVSMTSRVNSSVVTTTYTPTITVSDVSAGLKDVACTVTWSDRANGPRRTVRLETLVVER